VDTDVLIAVIGSSGVTVILGAIANGVIQKRKLSADATHIITQAAGGIVLNLQEDNGRLRAENIRVSSRFDRFKTAVRRRDDKMRKLFDAHATWDQIVVKELRRAGLNLPDPPVMELAEVDFNEEDEDEEKSPIE
jgi:hypothetical protein